MECVAALDECRELRAKIGAGRFKGNSSNGHVADGGLQDAAYAHEKAERNIVWKLEKLFAGESAVLIVRAADESSTMPR